MGGETYGACCDRLHRGASAAATAEGWHRLSRGGHPQAKAVFHRIVLSRRRHKDPNGVAYFAKRQAEGLTDRDVVRCLKRYIAREIYRVLQNPRPIPQTEHLRLRRLALHTTLAAQHFQQWPSGISRIEQGKNRDHDLTKRYREWLNTQGAAAA